MAFPLIPTIMGGTAGIGALMSLFGKKKPAETTQLPTLSSQQQSAINNILGQAQQGLQDPTAGFEPIEQNAMQNFYGSTLPGIAERFAGLGGTRSSGYNAAMTGAGQGLQSQLAAQKAQYGLQNRSGLAQLLGLGMSPQFENIYQPEQPGAMQELGLSLLGAGVGGLGKIGAKKYISGLGG